MGFLKKLWKDRVSEYPNRRILTDEDNNETLVTVARSEGNISEVGDAFSAENMNDLEQRVADGFEEVNNSLTQNTNGKFELPNGLKMCWGKVTLTPSIATNSTPMKYRGEQQITLPITYNNQLVPIVTADSIYPYGVNASVIIVSSSKINISIASDTSASKTAFYFVIGY